jgi:hypothetical protein
MPGKYKYRVRDGFEYGPRGEYKAGSIVELTEDEARYVLDKLELAEIVQNVPPVTSPTNEQVSDTPPEEPDSKEETVNTPPTPRSTRRRSGGDD